MFLEEFSGKNTIGWQWRAPWHLLPRVVSEPEIVCGNKPWDPKIRPDAGFPLRAGTKRLSAEFEVSTHAQGVYNTVFSLWGVSAIPASRTNITHEIMIWTDLCRMAKDFLARSNDSGKKYIQNLPPRGRMLDNRHESERSGCNPSCERTIARR